MKTKSNPTLGPGPKIHPGVMLKKYVLDERDLTQSKFALATGLPVSRISEIIHGKRGITMDAAIRFARVLDMSEGFWLNLQSAYERACALEERGKEYARLKPLPKLSSQAA
ncbi:MAG: HigA family addiction module antitoxin [Verrucomicrobiota bacterium]